MAGAKFADEFKRDAVTCIVRFVTGVTDGGYAVWLYYRFALSLPDVKDVLSERGDPGQP